MIGGLTSAKGKALNGRRTIAAVPSRLRPRYSRVGGSYDILGKNLERGTDECSICLGPFRSPIAWAAATARADCLTGCRAQGVVDCALCRRELSPWDRDAA